MKKFCLILSSIVLTAFLFTGCSKKDVTEYNYTYKDENALWNAEYKVNSTITFSENDIALNSESETKNVLIVTYKGELTDLSNVKHLEISYECSTSSGKLINDYDIGESISTKTFTLNSGGEYSVLPAENDIVKVIIDVDGDVQNLELENNQ